MGGKDVCTLSEPEESRLPSFEPDPKAFSGALSVRVLMPTSGSQAVPKRGILKEEDGWLTASSVELQILVSFLDLPMSMCFLQSLDAILSRFQSSTQWERRGSVLSSSLPALETDSVLSIKCIHVQCKVSIK